MTNHPSISVKQILWADHEPPNNTCYYDHVRGKHTLGDFLISWKGWKDYPSIDLLFHGEYAGTFNCVDTAKTAAQTMINDLILSSIETTGV